MFDRLYNLWEHLRTSLWFVPGVMSLLSVVLAGVILHIDSQMEVYDPRNFFYLYNGSATDAKDILGLLLSSMITMTTLAISITMVVLTMAASQLGPRLIRSVMGDRKTQVIIGIFFMTIVFCFLVLRTVHGDMGATNVPRLSISLAVLICFGNLFVLLFFVHHLGKSTSSNTMIARVGRELIDSIHRLSPNTKASQPVRDYDLPDDFFERAKPLVITRNGYVQAIDYRALTKFAAEHDLLFYVENHAGDFVIEGQTVLHAYPHKALDQELSCEARSFIIIGDQRTPTQDIEYSMRHLIEIALRALSPSMDDPYTGIAVINKLSEALGALFQYLPPAHVYHDQDEIPRVVGVRIDHAQLIDTAFSQIRQSAETQPSVVRALFESLNRLAKLQAAQPYLDSLQLQAERIHENARHARFTESDANALDKVFENTLEALQPA